MSSHSARPSDNLSARKYASRPTSASGRAQYALHHAKAKFDESNMLMMDFGTFAEVWNALDGLTSEELRIALNTLEEEPAMNQTAMMLRMMLLSQWGEVDGLAAAEYAIALKQSGMMQGMALMGCMSSWIKTDPQAAEAWYEKNKSAFKGGMWGNSGVKAMFVKGLAKRDINAAFAKMDLTKTSDRKTAIDTMATLVAEESLRGQVIEKVQSIEDKQLKHKMFKRMVGSLSYQNLDAATELLDQIQDADPEKYSEYQQSLLGGMRMVDPEAAIEYASTEITDEKTRSRELISSFAQYASNDAEAAQTWLDSQNFENKDKYYSRASSNQRWQDPEQSMEWALKIEDEDMRTDEVIEVYKRWNEEHEEGAKAWLGQLDEESQAAILEGVEENT
jgi:hypothetical protein